MRKKMMENKATCCLYMRTIILIVIVMTKAEMKMQKGLRFVFVTAANLS